MMSMSSLLKYFFADEPLIVKIKIFAGLVIVFPLDQ